MTSRETPARPAPPLRTNPEYVRWLTGDLLLDAGAAIGMFAFPLVTFAVTESLAATGLIGLIQGLGQLVGLVPGGLLADRWDRRRLRLIGAGTGALLQAALIAVLLTGWASVAVLAVLAFADRLRGALVGSASTAMLKQIVPPEQLPRAFAVNEGRSAAVEMGSGPAGGALFAVNIVLPALAQLLGNLASFFATLTMRGDYRPRTPDAPATRIRNDLTEAWRWAISQPIRLQVMALAMLVNLGLNGLVLAVLLHLADTGVPAPQIGVLSTVLAASILLGAIAAPRLVDRVPTGVLTIAPLLLMAVLAAAIPLVPNIWWIGAIYAVMGLGLAPLNAASQGFFTHITPKAMLGRIDSLMGLGAMGLMPLAPAIAGWGLDRLGPMPTMWIFAAITALGAAIALLGPHLRSVPVASHWVEHARDRGLTAD
ncbi:MAG: MFS transporter [Brachybacterium sp.]|nr:MFS transporter [Brachybacterium sp.]